MLEYSDRVECLPDIRKRPEEEGRVLLYNPRSDQLHMLEAVEARIFALCDGRSISQLVAAAKPDLLEGRTIRSEMVAAEVIAFLIQLKQRELVRFL